MGRPSLEQAVAPGGCAARPRRSPPPPRERAPLVTTTRGARTPRGSSTKRPSTHGPRARPLPPHTSTGSRHGVPSDAALRGVDSPPSLPTRRRWRSRVTRAPLLRDKSRPVGIGEVATPLASGPTSHALPHRPRTHSKWASTGRRRGHVFPASKSACFLPLADTLAPCCCALPTKTRNGGAFSRE